MAPREVVDAARAARRRPPRPAGRRPRPSRPARRRGGPRRRSASRGDPGGAAAQRRHRGRRASRSPCGRWPVGRRPDRRSRPWRRGEHDRPAVERGSPGRGERPAPCPRRSSRWTTCMPPDFSTRTTAPHQPVSASSTTRPGSAARSTGFGVPCRAPGRASRRQSPASTSVPYLSPYPPLCCEVTHRRVRIRRTGSGQRPARRANPTAVERAGRAVPRRLGTRNARVPTGVVYAAREVRQMSEERRLAVLRAIVAGLRPDLRAGRAARRWSSATTSGSPRRPSATTWRCWRRRASSTRRTRPPAGCRRTRATASSSTGSARSSR